MSGAGAVSRSGQVADTLAGNADQPILAARKACLGGLINNAGMQRMLSHRAVMFLAMGPGAGGQHRTAMLSQAKQAIDRFRAIARGFTGDYSAIGAPPELADWIAGVLAPRRRAYETLTALFGTKALQALDGTRRESSPPATLMSELVELVSAPLLAELNGLVQDLSEELALTSRQEQEHVERIGQDIGGMLDDIQRVGLNIKMISVNALIQASRAGEAGRGFAVIANEIKDLSEQMHAVATGIESNIRKVVTR